MYTRTYNNTETKLIIQILFLLNSNELKLYSTILLYYICFFFNYKKTLHASTLFTISNCITNLISVIAYLLLRLHDHRSRLIKFIFIDIFKSNGENFMLKIKEFPRRCLLL